MGIETRRMIAAALGLGGPVAWGVASGHPALGTLAAIGALAVSGVSMDAPPTRGVSMAVAPADGVSTGTTPAGSVSGAAAPVDGVVAKGASLVAGLVRGGYAVAVTTAAGLVGAVVGGHGWIAAVTIVLVAAVVAVVGGISRPMAEHTTRFIVFMVISTGLAKHAAPVAAAVLFAEGAIWGLLVTALCTHTKQPRAKQPRTKQPRLGTRRTEPAAVPPANPAPTKRALLRRWWRTLGTVRGWQYPIRLTACLAAAEIIGLVWPQPTASWIAVTVVIVVRRQLDGALRRAVERAAGTGAGVVAGSAVLLWVPAPWLFVLLVAGLAAVRPVLKDRDYTLYATVMTPLVLLLMEGGGRVAPATIGYRLADTAIGCVLALGLGYLPWAVRRERSTRAIVD
ncbi:FUSC family protein [Nonomuraea sp. NEAU-A123]|uniref:FUSC family protein n=1 Tax=Nonomuraea sp. NEAU-A123 TaxID=2839649 RepID=UPI001BE48774|nr:FUSC family protein [Nonomuraea sp. NEAU-A123]MBT2233041.1 FUSC family protein [Nonomuraea sp. NEAU-A123]